MTEEEAQEATARAVLAARDPRKRHLIIAGAVVFVVSVIVGAVTGWLLYASTVDVANDGVELSEQVKRDCATGENTGESCDKAKEVRAPAALPGVPGRDGADGADGRDGIDGRDGRDGKDGKDGRDGKDGADGADSTVPGPPGAPGSPGADSTVPGPQGEPGTAGRGVESVECTSGKGSFTFHYSDGTSETVTCDRPPSPSPTTSPDPGPTGSTQPSMRRWTR